MAVRRGTAANHKHAHAFALAPSRRQRVQRTHHSTLNSSLFSSALAQKAVDISEQQKREVVELKRMFLQKIEPIMEERKHLNIQVGARVTCTSLRSCRPCGEGGHSWQAA